MQKLSERNTYTPTDAFQVCSNCDYALNKDIWLYRVPSVHSLKTSDNNLEGNLPVYDRSSGVIKTVKNFYNFTDLLVSSPEQVQGFSPAELYK